MNKPVYNILEGDEGVPFIQMVEPYTGVCFTLGAVNFGGTDEEPVLQYEYNIIEGRDQVDSLDKFEEFAAKLVLELMEDKLKRGDLLYTGGT